MKGRKMENKQGTGIHQQFPDRGAWHPDSWNLGVGRENALKWKPQVWLLPHKRLCGSGPAALVRGALLICPLGLFCSELL